MESLTTNLIITGDCPQLEYVRLWGDRYYPSIDEYTGKYCDTRVAEVFAERYNSKEIDPSFSYSEFVETPKRHRQSLTSLDEHNPTEEYVDSDIKLTVEALHLDIEKFWYLALFLYDYMCGCCVKGEKPSPHPIEQLDSFMNAIESNCSEGYIAPNFISPIKITMKVGSQKPIYIDSSIAIAYLLKLYKENRDNIKGVERVLLYDTFSPLPYDGGECQTLRIAFFTEQLYMFLKEIQPEVAHGMKPNVSSYSAVSVDKMLLVSRVVHYLGLVQDKEYCVNPEKLKGLIKKYRGRILDRTNEHYYMC